MRQPEALSEAVAEFAKGQALRRLFSESAEVRKIAPAIYPVSKKVVVSKRLRTIKGT
jgi:hypothetical protein